MTIHDAPSAGDEPRFDEMPPELAGQTRASTADSDPDISPNSSPNISHHVGAGAAEGAPGSASRSAPVLLGALDNVEPGGRAAGWARATGGDITVDVEILIDDVMVGHVIADQYRSDLAQNGWADCAFWYDIPHEFLDGLDHTIEARFAATGDQLRHSPRTFAIASSPRAPRPWTPQDSEPEPSQVATIDEAVRDQSVIRRAPISGPSSVPSYSSAHPRPIETAGASSLLGSFDGVEEGGWAAGWARRVGSDEKLVIEAWIDGEMIGEVIADQYRDDLNSGGFADCAFWFGIPEDLLDGREHSIELRHAGSDQSLEGSPRTFSIRTFVAGQVAEGMNLISTADFDFWPTGLRVSPRERFEEIVSGWYYDFRRGTEPQISVEADKPRDVGLLRHAYAMRVTVEDGGADGYMRLIVPIAVAPRDLERYRFSIGLRRPPLATDDALHVTEIFLATIDNMAVERIATLRRALKPRGTLRIANLPAITDPKKLADVDPEATIALVIELRGNGDLTIFSPLLVPGSAAPPLDEDGKLGEFEDPRIRGQVNELKLSPIWQRHLAVAARTVGAAPVPVISRVERRALSAVPFIQIVVPVYNATVDVEDLLRSILRHTDSPMEILLFDDGSGAFAEARIGAWEALDPRIRYFRHAENVGYTRNINFGLQASVSDHVVLLNSDTVVTRGWLRKLYGVLASDEMIAGVGPLSNAASWQSVPRTKSATGEWVVNAFDEKVTPDRIAALLEQMDDGTAPDFPLLNGFCTLFRKAALEQVGYFDDGAFPKGYGEENDLCLRLTKAGWSLRVAPDTYVHHSKSKSFGTSQRKELSKAANQILRGKHPEINFPVLEERMQNDPTVNRIRRALTSQLGIEPQPGGASPS